jgi:hypothetical protein
VFAVSFSDIRILHDARLIFRVRLRAAWITDTNVSQIPGMGGRAGVLMLADS